MPLLYRYFRNISTINGFLQRYRHSSLRNNSVHLRKYGFQNSTRFISSYDGKVNASVDFYDRNPSSNRKSERSSRDVNKKVMSNKLNTSSHTTSVNPNNESHDISLTFWIFLWSCLAIVASWIYTKLNTKPEVDTDIAAGVEQADEHIARKLVKEISKNDHLVKRSTFRRQRSYEIIDGEVRIYYDVAFDESLGKEKENYGKNIIDSAEVEDFPIRRSSMDEMELIFPGNLARIIEEGEEELEDECEEVTQMSSCVKLEEGINFPEQDCKESFDDEKQQEFIKPLFVESTFDNVMIHGLNEPLEAGITNDTESTKGKIKEENDNNEITQTQDTFLKENSSSDELSTVSQESISKENANISRPADQDRGSLHSSNSTPTFVYKLTEVSASENGFTVIRKEIRKLNNSTEEKESTRSCEPEYLQTREALSSYTPKEVVECLQYVKQTEERSTENCEDAEVNISCPSRRQEKNFYSDINNDSLLSSSDNKGQDIETVSEQFIQEDGTQQRNMQSNEQGPEMVKKCCKSDRKCYDRDQVGKEDENLDDDQFYNDECNISEGPYNPLEEGSDIFIDNSGDFLFKVIGGVDMLEDIDEADEYLAAEEASDHLSTDENSNYKTFESKLQFSKNWKSLPSWEEAHHIHHQEVDRDVDDFNVDSEYDDERENELNQEIVQIIKAKESIVSMIETIPEESSLECAEVFKESNELSLVIQAVADNTEHVSLNKECDEINDVAFTYEVPNTSEILLAEIVKSKKICPADHILTNHEKTSKRFPNAAHVVGKERKANNIIEDPKDETDLKASWNNNSQHNFENNMDIQLFGKEDIMADNKKTTEVFQVKETMMDGRTSHESDIDQNDDSDDEIIVACLNESKERVSEAKIIYASEVAEISSPSYHVVLSHENYETKRFQETSLDCVPLSSSPVTDLKEQLPTMHEQVFYQGTDVDRMSDVDEIDIDNIEQEENYKSKSVTDLDQALASYSSSEYNTCRGISDNDTSYSGLSKSVPDILDSHWEESLQEVPVRTNSNNSINDLTENMPKKTLSISTPEIGALRNKERLKKVTKIKIVHVKFLEVQDGSGSDNMEEESFMVDGDMPMLGKMKRRSRNLSSSPIKTEKVLNKEVVDECLTAEKVKKKELEFGFDDIFNDFPKSPSSTQRTPSAVTTQRKISSEESQVHPYSSTESLPEKERFVAGAVPSHSSQAEYTSSQGIKLTEKFQMRQDAPQYKKTSSHKTESKKTSKTKTASSQHSGNLVTVRSGIINECSSDADSETSYVYNTPSPRRTRKTRRVLVHSNSIDSASSSDADRPQRRNRTKDKKTSMSQIFGVQNEEAVNVKEEEKMSERNPKLFSRFRHLQERDALQLEKDSYIRQQEWATQRNSHHYQRSEAMHERIPVGANKSMEFNPFADVDGYHGFDQPFERNHSPTSISSDQSSVFSFNCDFEPMPAPATSSFNPEVYTCENPMCRKQDILLGPEKTNYKSCPACFTYYCSSACRKLHWPAHKQSCYFGRVNTYVRSIIRLCQRRQDLSMYLSQLARDGYKKKGRGVVMATFNSPELAREFITKGHDAFSGRKPTYSSLLELNHEGVISKHRVALMQAVRDYEPNEEFVFNIAVVSVNDIPIQPAPRYKLNTVLHCIKMALNEKIVAHQPKEYGKVETRLFALPKCSRHEFVNEMEARRHYCRNLSKNLRQYNIKLKEDYEDCYKKLCMYVEHDIPFESMTVYGQRSGLTYKCVIAPEQNYALNAEYC